MPIPDEILIGHHIVPSGSFKTLRKKKIIDLFHTPLFVLKCQKKIRNGIQWDLKSQPLDLRHWKLITVLMRMTVVVILFYYIPCTKLLLFFSEIDLVLSREKYFTSDDMW